MSNKYTIPEGTRDLVLGECWIKKNLTNDLEHILDTWGYKEVVTPTTEFYQTFNPGFQYLEDEDMYKFFDSNGRILVLRPDMTLPIARVVATRFKDSPMPLRFRYTANIFHVNNKLSGRRNEFSDCGVEYIGAQGFDSDLEILVTALESMKILKNIHYKLEIGNVNIFKAAVKNINLNEEEIATLLSLMDKKSLKALDDFLAKTNLSEQHKQFFTKLPWLFGGVEVLEEVKTVAFNDEIKEEINYLEKLNDAIIELGYKDLVTFDLGMVHRLSYYSGLIFRGYADGVGITILTGGRYDKLIKIYGRDLPAVGFAIKLDALLEAIDEEIYPKLERLVIEYPTNKIVDALKLAKTKREEGLVVELHQNNELTDIKERRD
ncbi:MAG: ATP phosphoribosyltransferase regulatory subunit [Erysipelotrichaceae bacterium]